MCSLWSTTSNNPTWQQQSVCITLGLSLSAHVQRPNIRQGKSHVSAPNHVIIPQKHKFKLLHLSHNTTSTVKSSTSDESSCRRDQHASLYSITALMKSTHIAWHEHLGKKREIEIMHEVKRYDIGIAKETDWTQCLLQSQNLCFCSDTWEQKGPPNTRHIAKTRGSTGTHFLRPRFAFLFARFVRLQVKVNATGLRTCELFGYDPISILQKNHLSRAHDEAPSR